MVEIINILRREHADMAKLLDVLDRQIDLIERRVRVNRELIGDVLDYFRGYPVLCHHPKEDLLYGKLRRVADAPLLVLVGDLVAQHGELDRLLRDCEAALDNLLPARGSRPDRFVAVLRHFVVHYRDHLEREDEVLFPAALNLIAEEDWAEIDRQALEFEDPLFGKNFDARFAALREQILALDRPERAPRAESA